MRTSHCAALVAVFSILLPHLHAQTPTLAAIEARQTHASVDVLTLGEGMARVYIFLPAEPAVKGKLPIVFFAHGWQGMNPENYGALLDHLAREGNVVVYPVYQQSDTTSPQLVVAAAAAAERGALTVLKARGIEPDSQRVVYFGYSMGAAISLKLAATADAQKISKPQALVLVAPGDAYHVAKGADAKSIWPPLRQLRATLPIAIVTGEDDKAIGLPTARKLAAGLCPVTKSDRRVLLVLPGDEHGDTKVHAGHGSPGAPDSRYDFALKTPAGEIPKHIPGRRGFEESASLNQLDFFGYWRVLDDVIDSLFSAPSTSSRYVPPADVFKSGTPAQLYKSGTPAQLYKSGTPAQLYKSGTPAQLYLGTWPDGAAYKPAHVEDPCAAR